MAVNVAWTNVIEPLSRLCATLGGGLKLYFQDKYETRGSSFLNIMPVSDEEVERDSNAAAYQYTFEVRLYRRMSKEAGDPTGLKALTGDVENFKYLIASNRSLTESGTYRWHEAIIESVDYRPELSEEEAAESNLRVVSFVLSVKVTAII